MLDSAKLHARQRAIERAELTIRVAMTGEHSAAIELLGVVRRPTVGALAAEVSRLRSRAVVVDLSGVTQPNSWLLSGLAKAHAALIACKATMRLVVNDDEAFGLLYSAGLTKLSPTFVTRHYGESLDARLELRRNRTFDRQRVVDLTAGRAHARGRVQVLTVRPGRRTLRGSPAFPVVR